jgi:hypothetical protein
MNRIDKVREAIDNLLFERKDIRNRLGRVATIKN